MTALHAYLQQPRPVSLVRGVSDCAAFVAGWMAVAMGYPVRTLYLGRALSDESAHRIVKRAGGLDRLARMILEGHGWTPVAEAGDGDVILGKCPVCYSRTLLGIWSAGRAVSIGSDGQLRIIEPHLIQSPQAWRWNQPPENHGH